MHRCLVLVLFICICRPAAEPYPWQIPHAAVDARGDLRWQPHPYRYAPAGTVRYIDYETGDDRNDGSQTSPWKHHPWDTAASALAKTGSADTYVFKGGVSYRGQLEIAASGNTERAIQLCRDPDWGDGPAVLTGSQAVVGWQRAGIHELTPRPELVYTAEVDWLPRTVWVIPNDGEAIRIPLARMPNWRVESRDDVKAGWWSWSNTGVHHYQSSRKVGNQTLNFATDPEHLTPEVLALADGATVWTEYGWVLGTPYPSMIKEVDPSMGGMAFGSQWGDNNGSHIVSNCRYFLENSPGFLDDPQGEHWIEQLAGGRARIHLIFPEGLSPDTCRVEVGRHREIITGNQRSHIRISGLDFRYTNAGWNINGPFEGMGPAIRLNGPFADVTVNNCAFTDIGAGVMAKISGSEGAISGLRFNDNDILRVDECIIQVLSADQWGMGEGPFAYVEQAEVMRNRARYVGMRPSRFGQANSIDFTVVRTLHAAGNILDMCWGAGILVYCGKNMWSNDDLPYARLMIHHNKVTNAVLSNNDCGGIETWQSGPAYVYNNIVGDARGFQHYNYADGLGKRHNQSFGFAFYLDGAFKNYHFNNIAYGRSRDWESPFITCSAFQEIHSYQNTFFNNSASNFLVGSRRQAPDAGRNKYLGNIFDGIDQMFRHSDAKGVREPNAHHAGEHGTAFAYDTNAYSRNIFHEVDRFGLFEADGFLRDRLDDFARGLVERQSLAGDVGEMLSESPLPAGDVHDFTPSKAVDGQGAQVFVPWPLFGCVAEWNFYPSQSDGRIIDEHWYLTEYHVNRGDYHKQPTFPLMPAAGRGSEVAIDGPLENWCAGAVAFDGVDDYYRLANAPLNEPISYSTINKAGPHRGQTIAHTVIGAGLKSPQVYDSNLLIEVYFRAESDGILLSKMSEQAGYHLTLRDGQAVFTLRHAGRDVSLHTEASLADGAWHHLIVEADRATTSLCAYVDGAVDATGSGLGPVSLANDADLFVGGSPDGDHLTGAIDCMRIALGTLADAGTTIDELCAWQFDGPMLRDFNGRKPMGAGRDAGAIEAH